MAARKKTEDATPAQGQTVTKVLASDVVAAIQKKFGANLLQRASAERFESVPRIPTGILSLDAALGGGFPLGRISVVGGQRSAGKTTIVSRAIGNAQRICHKCYKWIEHPYAKAPLCGCVDPRRPAVTFLDVEGTFDVAWAACHGVLVDDVLLSRPETAEQAVDVADALLRSQMCDVLVIDSIAFMVPDKEVQGSADQDPMGGQARVMGKGIRKFVSALNWLSNLRQERKPTILLTNQVRMKIGVVFGSPETSPGGLAPGFAASVEVKCGNGKYKVDDDEKRAWWVDHAGRIEKNKCSPPRGEFEFRMGLLTREDQALGEILDGHQIIKWAEHYGLLVRKGTYELMGRDVGKKDDIEPALRSDPAFAAEVRWTLLNLMVPR